MGRTKELKICLKNDAELPEDIGKVLGPDAVQLDSHDDSVIAMRVNDQLFFIDGGYKWVDSSIWLIGIDPVGIVDVHRLAPTDRPYKVEDSYVCAGSVRRISDIDGVPFWVSGEELDSHNLSDIVAAQGIDVAADTKHVKFLDLLEELKTRAPIDFSHDDANAGFFASCFNYGRGDNVQIAYYDGKGEFRFGNYLDYDHGPFCFLDIGRGTVTSENFCGDVIIPKSTLKRRDVITPEGKFKPQYATPVGVDEFRILSSTGRELTERHNRMEDIVYPLRKRLDRSIRYG